MDQEFLDRTELYVSRAQRCDREAMNELVLLWTPHLERVVRGWADQEHVGDIVQQTWIDALGSLAGLSDPSRFPAWIRRIAYRCWANHMRAAKREGPADEGTRETPPMPASPWVGGLLALLSPGHGKVVSMHYLEGYSVAEIAHALQIPAGTVKSRLHHARRLLRRKIDDE